MKLTLTLMFIMAFANLFSTPDAQAQTSGNYQDKCTSQPPAALKKRKRLRLQDITPEQWRRCSLCNQWRKSANIAVLWQRNIDKQRMEFKRLIDVDASQEAQDSAKRAINESIVAWKKASRYSEMLGRKVEQEIYSLPAAEGETEPRDTEPVNRSNLAQQRYDEAKLAVEEAREAVDKAREVYREHTSKIWAKEQGDRARIYQDRVLEAEKDWREAVRQMEAAYSDSLKLEHKWN